jgi:hypothetical protein
MFFQKLVLGWEKNPFDEPMTRPLRVARIIQADSKMEARTIMGWGSQDDEDDKIS